MRGAGGTDMQTEMDRGGDKVRARETEIYKDTEAERRGRVCGRGKRRGSRRGERTGRRGERGRER